MQRLSCQPNLHVPFFLNRNLNVLGQQCGLIKFYNCCTCLPDEDAHMTQTWPIQYEEITEKDAWKVDSDGTLFLPFAIPPLDLPGIRLCSKELWEAP